MAELYSRPLRNDTSLISYYRLDDTTDYKAAHALTNNGTTTFTAGKFGAAANFGSANSTKYLNTSSNMGIDGGVITISLWIKLLAEIGSGVWTFAMQSNSTSKVRHKIFYNFNAGTIQMGWDRARTSTADEGPNYNITLGTSNWYHVAYVYDNTNVTGYLNGVAVGTPTAASGTGGGVSPDDFSIGQDTAAGLTQFASALIDDVAVFSRVLTATEVNQLYLERANIGKNGLRPHPFSPGIAR